MILNKFERATQASAEHNVQLLLFSPNIAKHKKIIPATANPILEIENSIFIVFLSMSISTNASFS